jgi:hypothetical protein
MSKSTVTIEVTENDVVFISIDGEGQSRDIANELLELAKDSDIDYFIGKNVIQ